MAKQEAGRMFRKQALDHLSSPEQLDQLPQVVTRKSWLPILTLAGGLCAAVVWSVLGRIPVTVEGKGLLIHRHQVVPFQSPAYGQIVDMSIKVGDHVEKHQILGRINQPDLVQLLEQERVRLKETKDRDSAVLGLHAHRTKLEKEWIESDRLRIQRQIESVQHTADEQLAKSEAYFETQVANLGKLDDLTAQLGKAVEEHYERARRLQREGHAKPSEVYEAQRDYFDNKVKIADINLRMHEVQLLRIQAEGLYQQQMNRVAEFQSDLDELSIRMKKIDQLYLEAESDSHLGISKIENTIARYEEQLETKGQIISEYAGRVLEVTAAMGQFVGAGQRLGAIESEDKEGELVAVGYFALAAGKKIKPDMEARISPSTVQRERDGSMIGMVFEVSRYPVTTDAVTNVVGNAELARTLTAGGSWIEVVASIERDSDSPTGFKWTSGKGPDADITAATTVSIRATIESRRPISYVIPLLRRWSGS